VTDLQVRAIGSTRDLATSTAARRRESPTQTLINDEMNQWPNGVNFRPLDRACTYRATAAIDAITLFTDDLPATRKFYLDVFGLPIVFEDEDSTVFQFGGTVVNLLHSTAGPELVTPLPVGSLDAGVRTAFMLEVADVDAMCVELVRRGVTLLNGPIDRPWGIRTASFRDLGGHVWEIAK